MKSLSSLLSSPLRLGALLFALLVSPAAVFAGGTVSSFTHAELESAMAGGGTVGFSGSGEINLTNSISVAQNTILQSGGHAITIRGSGTNRLFQVQSNVSFTIDGITLADGKVLGTKGVAGNPAGPGETVMGGAILNESGTLTLVNCTLTNHYVRGGESGDRMGDPMTPTGTGGDARGAAIWSSNGSLYLTNCTIVANRAEGGAGDLQFGVGGYSGHALGGALYAQNASLIFHSVRLLGNGAAGGAVVGGGISGQGGRGGEALGGAVYATNGSLVVVDSQWADNTCAGGKPSGIVSSGRGSGSALGGAFFFASNNLAEFHGSVFTNNSAMGGNGGRFHAAGNGTGGAVFNHGTLRLVDCSFVTNQAAGGQSTDSGYARGGAIYSLASIVIDRCTLADNQSKAGPVTSETGANFAGEVAEGGAVWAGGNLALTNSTFVSNVVLGGAAGGGGGGPADGGAANGGAIAIDSGTAAIVNVTIAGNAATGGDPRPVGSGLQGPSQGGGIYATNATVVVRNTIIANSTSGSDVWGQLQDAGYNIASDGSAAFSATGSLNGVDPKLSPIAANGGPTATMALLIDSPALDAIPNGFPRVDQRGTPRPQRAAADIGAFESDASLPRLTASLSGQDLVLAIYSQPGSPIQIQTSSDLIHWNVETNLTPAEPVTTLMLPTTAEKMFFRTRAP